MTLDNDVRLFVYRFFLDHGRPPVALEVARALGRTPGEAEAAFRRLAVARVLVLAPGTPYIWMASPLSALPTPFRVDIGERVLFGNCIWDALGVAAMLDSNAEVTTWCPDCGEDLRLSVSGGGVRGEGVLHFAVPAADWWEDIGAA